MLSSFTGNTLKRTLLDTDLRDVVALWLKPVVLNLCYSDAFELQLPETPVRTAGGEGFWELQSKTPE